MARLNIEGHLHRRVNGRLLPAWTRHYATIDTAITRCTTWMLINGEVGDIIEFTLKINGMQVGTIRMRADGKVVTEWNSDEAAKLRNMGLKLPMKHGNAGKNQSEFH